LNGSAAMAPPVNLSAEMAKNPGRIVRITKTTLQRLYISFTPFWSFSGNNYRNNASYAYAGSLLSPLLLLSASGETGLVSPDLLSNRQDYFSTGTMTGLITVVKGGQICDCFPGPPETTI